ncbi:MAG: hypothetical protein QXW94_02160 [Desulfurococcaceae archaeon]
MRQRLSVRYARLKTPTKTWKYGAFAVEAYTCRNFQTHYGEYYDRDGKHGFALKPKKEGATQRLKHNHAVNPATG